MRNQRGLSPMRNQRGISMIVLVIFIAFMVLLPLAIFGFELMRVYGADKQLRSVCDAAALSGTAAMTSAVFGNSTAANQQVAMQEALRMWQRNSIYGVPLTQTTANFNPQSPSAPTSVAPTQCVLNIILLNQAGAQVQTGDITAKRLQIDAYYGYAPPIGTAIGFPSVVLSTNSTGGLPMLDLALCFDISGSMDDQTNVTFVKRYTDAQGFVHYDTAVISGHFAQGQIYNVSVPPITGTRVNCFPPENLSWADNANKYNFQFNPNLRANLGAGTNELGDPPGNVTPGSSDFTDIVTNLDGNATFGSWTDPTTKLSFANIAVLTEASRKNLDNQGVLNTALNGHNKVFVNGTAFQMPAANVNYSTVYTTQGKNLVQPMNAAIAAAQNFVTTLANSADCHFSLVSFSDGIGTQVWPSSTNWGTITNCTTNNVDDSYSAAGTGTFPMPYVKLDPSNDNVANGYMSKAIADLQPTGSTDIASSLNQAITDLTLTSNLTRSSARRAIVLFTDGIPNLPTGGAGPTQSCYNAAGSAASNNIVISCIGLSQNQAIIPQQSAILSKIASTAGGIYVPANVNTLNQAFQSIARSLVVLR